MPIPVTFNGVTYSVPITGEINWGPALTRYLVALGSFSLTPSGGAFTLTSDVNFGPTFGLFAKYFTSVSSTPATGGVLRLAKGDSIDWRNNANSGDNVLAVNGSDQLTFNGSVLPTNLASLPNDQIWIGSASNVATPQTLTGDVTVTNAGVTSIGAGRIVNSQISNTAAIAYTKLSLTNSIVNADISSGAAIAYTKLAALSASIVPVTNSSGFLTSSSTTVTQLSYLDATSSIQTQLNGKQSTLTEGNLTEATSSVLTILGGTNAVIGSGTSIQVKQASGSQSGYLSSTDWTTFNNKQSTLILGNLTDAGTDGITVTGGTGAVVGSGTSLSQHVADTTHNGYLASTDWNTFNGKQAAGNYITALTGDITASGPGSAATTLATVNSNVGSFTNASITVNGKGLITAASSGGAGSGTVNSGTANHLAYYATSTNAVSNATNVLLNAAGYLIGGILQVGIVTTVTPTSTTSSSFQATNLSLSFTPKSSTSTIIIFATGNLYNSDSLNGNLAFASIFRDSTNLGDASKGMAYVDATIGSGTDDNPCCMIITDAPGDTSAHTYAVKIASDTGGNTTKWIFHASKSSMVIVEVGQ